MDGDHCIPLASSHMTFKKCTAKNETFLLQGTPDLRYIDQKVWLAMTSYKSVVLVTNPGLLLLCEKTALI